VKARDGVREKGVEEISTVGCVLVVDKGVSLSGS